MRALAVLAVLAFVGGPVSGAAFVSDCSATGITAGRCTTASELGDDDVKLTADAEIPGDVSRGRGDTGDDASDSSGDDGEDGVGAESDLDRCMRVLSDRNRCMRLIDIPTVTGAPAVTLSDIATFRPIAAVAHSQPNGWTISGLDTNFYATGEQHVVDGVLLGQPASVRFTPLRWNWTYGDGESATRTLPGTPWASRSDEFNPTPTSHIFHQRGPFTITLSVDFTAEYRFAGGAWLPIAGTLPVPANDLQLTVGSAKTVLVDQNCNQNPRGPGC